MAYQLAAGTVSADGKLSAATLNADNKAAIKAALAEAGSTKDISTDAAQELNDILDAINELSDAGKAQTFANALAKQFMGGAGTQAAAATATDGTVRFDGLATGYYLVMSNAADAGLGAGETMTSAMLVTLDDDGTTATGKMRTSPTVSKEIKDGDGYDKVGDAGIVNGTVTAPTYRLTGTMPENIAEYEKYKYAFVDRLPTGLTYTMGRYGHHLALTGQIPPLYYI